MLTLGFWLFLWDGGMYLLLDTLPKRTFPHRSRRFRIFLINQLELVPIINGQSRTLVGQGSTVIVSANAGYLPRMSADASGLPRDLCDDTAQAQKPGTPIIRHQVPPPQSSMILLMECVPYAVIIARLSLLRIAALLSSAIVMDIPEKDKNQCQNDKTEHENRKIMRRLPHTAGIQLRNPLHSNLFMKEDKDSRAMIIELGDYSKWRAKIDLRLTSHKKHNYELS
ncbi:hypothetical protein Tco_1264676 [Tanacetum coccineum]